MPAGHHAVVGYRRERQGDEGGEPEHVAELEAEQLELPADEDAADDEDRVREVHPGPERDPPEILGLGELWPERDERDHQTEVGGVEDVPALPPDQVLRSHREGDHAQEDPDSVQAPPVAVQRAGHAEDEGGAVACQQTARRPQDHLVLEEGDGELDQRSGGKADQDLSDREAEVEDGLPQHLERKQHGGHVQARVSEAWEQDRVIAAADTHGASLRAHRGGRWPRGRRRVHAWRRRCV